MPRNSFITGQRHVVVFFPEDSSELHQLADQGLPESKNVLYFTAIFLMNLSTLSLKTLGTSGTL